MKNKRAASFNAWGIKDTTHIIPYILQYADFCDIYHHPIVSIFRTRQAARDWIKKNKCGYSWHPVKLWIQEVEPIIKRKAESCAKKK